MVIATKIDPIPERFGRTGIFSVDSNALAIFNITKSTGLWQIGLENGADSMPLCGACVRFEWLPLLLPGLTGQADGIGSIDGHNYGIGNVGACK
jgi:hypothetical protein